MTLTSIPLNEWKTTSNFAYLVHALRNELSLTVDAGEGPIPGHLV